VLLIYPDLAATPVSATFYTIGHSTHTIESFVSLLLMAGVNYLVDVRTVPKSRTNPQFNKDLMPETLGAYQIGYEHVAELGGLRGRQPLAPSANTYWHNLSFRNYADYAMSPAFAAGLRHLRDMGHSHTTAIMCAEAVWWRCHRRIIADYLLAAGENVRHIMPDGSQAEAMLTPSAHREGSHLVYAAAE